MKKFLYGALILAVLMSTAFAAFGEDWKTYANKKLGFSVEYPDIYSNASENTDGEGVFSFTAYNEEGGKFAFFIEYVKNDGKQTPESKLKDWTNMEEDEYGYVYGVEPIPGTAKAGDNFFTLDYLNDSAGVDDNGDPACIAHVYGIVAKKSVVTLTLIYPKEDAEKFAEITSRADKSLKVTEK
jgi:opacity protein-like surface antigen